jgi:hypothetical protein
MGAGAPRGVPAFVRPGAVRPSRGRHPSRTETAPKIREWMYTLSSCAAAAGAGGVPAGEREPERDVPEEP